MTKIKTCLFVEITTDSIYRNAHKIVELLKDIDTNIILKYNNIFIECPKDITEDEIIHKYCKELRWRQE